MAEVHYISSFNILLLSPDEELSRQVISYLKPFGYLISSMNNAMDGLERIRLDRPSLVLADIELPPLSGYDLCRTIKQDSALRNTPVILIADSYLNVEEKVKALSVDADDVIYRPVHGGELRARVRASLRAKAYLNQLVSERARFEELVSKRTRELEEITMGVVAALEKAASLNDEDTGSHILRVCSYSALLAREIGMEPREVERIRVHASLHDVGKVGLPDSILKKRGKLTHDEFEQMKQHTILGHELLTAAKVSPMARRIALHHHEWYNGSGYPMGLAADGIPIEARIVTLADVYDALTTDRCYRKAMPPQEAAQIIVKGSGTQFDPTIVQIFMRNHRKFLEIRNTYQDEVSVC